MTAAGGPEPGASPAAPRLFWDSHDAPPDPFPWDAAAATALGRLGWRPRDFWAATPRELAAALAPRGPAPLDRAGLDRLIRAHPDAPAP